MTMALEVDEAADRVVVHLARPEVRNAIDHQMVTELRCTNRVDIGYSERSANRLGCSTALLCGSGGHTADSAHASCVSAVRARSLPGNAWRGRTGA
jgi:hypothetical protein